ncbi:hypothetical protein A5784_03725 [Mycobacterium sp. 852013-50091_SCH5140682]|uniref:glycerate kinase n=1 Tax=Mycobacterium sp. 852013-50091_SCH5140682 TaxID=1834109 RepID=UPI0007EAEB7F|nr:hypothetical protein A5784_03725 [Mycobacterium sp. 852013-50091_SCH5140682]
MSIAGATGLPRTAEIALCVSGAGVEVANSCGSSTLRERRFDPLDSSSLGFSQSIRHSLTHEPSQVVLTLGGTTRLGSHTRSRKLTPYRDTPVAART